MTYDCRAGAIVSLAAAAGGGGVTCDKDAGGDESLGGSATECLSVTAADGASHDSRRHSLLMLTVRV